MAFAFEKAEKEEILGGLDAWQKTSVRPQPEKAELPIDVTLSGMVTDVKPLQSRKAELSIDVTLSGMVTDVKPLQPWNAEPPIDVTLSGMVTDIKPLQP